MIGTLQLAEGFTVEQMKKLAAPIKKNCIDSTTVDEALVNDITAGKLVNNEKLKCFLYCLYESVGTVSDLRLVLQLI